jgi:hypothetical protein
MRCRRRADGMGAGRMKQCVVRCAEERRRVSSGWADLGEGCAPHAIERGQVVGRVKGGPGLYGSGCA